MRIEERKEQNEQAKNYRIERISRRSAEPFLPPVDEALPAEQSSYKFGERKDRERKDEGHNAVRVYFDRDFGGLTAVHFSSLNLFRILNFDLSFGKFDPDDRREKNDYDYEICDELPELGSVERTLKENKAEFLNDERGEGRYDTRVDKEGNTVGNSVFGNSFAYPHGDAGSCRVEQYDDDITQSRGETRYVFFAARENRAELRKVTRSRIGRIAYEYTD